MPPDSSGPSVKGGVGEHHGLAKPLPEKCHQRCSHDCANAESRSSPAGSWGGAARPVCSGQGVVPLGPDRLFY